jgi:hypothetical protein
VRAFANGFTRTHGYIALGFLLVFSAFTLFLVCHPKNNEGLANIVVTTLATVSGPMVGAVARDCQSCCLKFSLSLLPWSAAFLAAGTLSVAGGHQSRGRWVGSRGHQGPRPHQTPSRCVDISARQTERPEAAFILRQRLAFPAIRDKGTVVTENQEVRPAS